MYHAEYSYLCTPIFGNVHFMSFLKQFVIPYRGLLDGHHHYEFLLDDEFFSHFEDSLIRQARFKAMVTLDKQGDLMTLHLQIEGEIDSTCDRCLAPIALPVNKSFDLIVKRAAGESDDPDLIYISPESHEFSLAGLLYEYACLAVPLTRSFDCSGLDPRPCNLDVLKYIQSGEGSDDPHPAWDVLKNIKNN